MTLNICAIKKNIIILACICSLVIVKYTHAQLGFCTGNSGDAIFIETFGSGITNSQLPPGTTTYTFSNGFPDDGFYTVSNSTVGNSFSWHQIGDHTVGDNDGKSLVVNAGLSAGEFYRTTVSGLCETTTYEFSAWLINLVIAGSFCSTQPSGSIPINVRFEIWDSTDTNLLAIGNTGNIVETSSPNWKQYGLVFQTLAGQNTVILKMINNGQGGCGNDLAIDDILFKSCGDSVIVADSLSNNSLSLCSTETPYTTTLTATPDFSVFNSHFYQWQRSTDGITWTDISGETNERISVSISTSVRYRTKVAEAAVNLNNAKCILYSDVYQANITQAPSIPMLACWESAMFNASNCEWLVTGTQPSQPSTECWEIATFNNTSCQWEVAGSQPLQPTLECWETTTFNRTSCQWEITGTQPSQPTIACWEMAVFNNALCQWDVSGTKPIEPPTSCNEEAFFNSSTCSWDVNQIIIEPTLETLFFCGTDDVVLSADIDNASYVWDTGEITKEIRVNQAGVYRVEITDTQGCLSIKSITLITYDLPVIESVSSDGTSIIINTVSNGDYEYSLDGIIYQRNNVFIKVESGLYTVYVRGLNGCSVVNSKHLHFVIPKFMTPNGDSFRDTFNLKGIEYFQSSEVYLFDRFGKLLKSAKNSAMNWDGTFNNQALPSGDYWYLIKIEGQIFRGHFTLYR